MPLEINLALEEPSTARIDGVPADVAQVVAQVGERSELRVAVLAGQGRDHVGSEPVAGAEDVLAEVSCQPKILWIHIRSAYFRRPSTTSHCRWQEDHRCTRRQYIRMEGVPAGAGVGQRPQWVVQGCAGLVPAPVPVRALREACSRPKGHMTVCSSICQPWCPKELIKPSWRSSLRKDDCDETHLHT